MNSSVLLREQLGSPGSHSPSLCPTAAPSSSLSLSLFGLQVGPNDDVVIDMTKTTYETSLWTSFAPVLMVGGWVLPDFADEGRKLDEQKS